jgi:heme/copper-type cytochrome/quinol oxidase subunit 3
MSADAASKDSQAGAGTSGGAVRSRRTEDHVQLIETPEEIAFELRAQEGALWTGGRLLIGIWVFAFAALAFAYFYLRSANNEDLWRPGGITAPTAAGAAIFAITLACAALALFGVRRFRVGETLDWEVAGWVAVLGGLVAVGLQIWQLTILTFAPGSSGYASCFIGWAAMNIALILSGVYWLETLLARNARLRRALREDGGTANSTLPAARLFRASLEGCSYYWGFIGGVALFFWVLFYVL